MVELVRFGRATQWYTNDLGAASLNSASIDAVSFRNPSAESPHLDDFIREQCFRCGTVETDSRAERWPSRRMPRESPATPSLPRLDRNAASPQPNSR